MIVPGLRSSRIHVIDTKPDPTNLRIVKTIEPEEVFKRAGYSRPSHCPLRTGRYLFERAGSTGRDLARVESSSLTTMILMFWAVGKWTAVRKN